MSERADATFSESSRSFRVGIVLFRRDERRRRRPVRCGTFYVGLPGIIWRSSAVPFVTVHFSPWQTFSVPVSNLCRVDVKRQPNPRSEADRWRSRVRHEIPSRPAAQSDPSRSVGPDTERPIFLSRKRVAG